MTETNEIEVLVADASHIGYVDEILDTISLKIQASRLHQGLRQVLTEREQAMYDDILEDAGYYQAFCLYTAMIDFPTFYEQSVSGEKQPVKERQKEKIQEIEKHKN